MSAFFLTIYRFFSKHRIIFYIFLLSFITFILLFATQIRFEEDILKSLPSDKQADPSAFVISNLKTTDKLIITLSLTDSLREASPDTLILFGQQLLDSLTTHFGREYIRNISMKASDSAVVSMMAMVANHLPSFLDEKDYQSIDSLISPESVDKAMAKNYRILITPGSIVLKQRILQDPLGITNLAYGKLKSLQAGDQYTVYNGSVFTTDLRNLFIFLSPENPVNETAKNEELINGLDACIAQMSESSSGTVKADYFGSIAVAVCNAKQLKKDIILTLFIAFSLIFLLIGWYFRSFRIPLFGLLPALFGGGLALAILSLVRGNVSAISLGIGSVILGLIVDYALYIINHFQRKGNIETVLREMSQTIVVCSITSAGAFLCLVFLDSTVLHDLGWFAALSVLGAALFALIILPQLLSVKRDRPVKEHRITWVDKFAALPFENNKLLAGALIMLIIIGFIFAGKAGFENNMSSLSFVTPTLAKAEENLTRITDYKLKNIYLVATGNTPEQALRNNERLSGWLDSVSQAGLVERISNAGPFLLSDSIQMVRIKKWHAFWNPAKIEQLKQLLQSKSAEYHFKPGVFDPFLTLLNSTWQPLSPTDTNLSNNPMLGDWMTIKPGVAMISTILKVKNENKQQVYNAFHQKQEYVMFDRQQITDRFVASVKQDFDLLVKLSMIFVSLLLILSFGRIELGIITALPMFMSWFITLGFMGITGITFNIFNIIISSFIFGLGVDYSILMMRGLQHDLKYGRNDIISYKVAIFLSSATTLLGVGALLFARHPALHSIAPIAIVGIVAIVLLTYVVIPFLFNGLVLNRARKGRFPVTARIVIKTIVTWGNIVSIAIILMVAGWIMYLFLPVSRKRKEYWFHWLFSKLSKGYIAFTFIRARKLINPQGETFTKPGIIISNHQSLIETPAFLRLHPKIIILTTTWVHKSPIFGPIAHLANFSNVENGIENIIGELQKMVDDGFSILIFPEGHRSEDHKIQRFHRGAFFLSEKLRIDIIPMVVFGSGDFLPKNAFWGRPNGLFMKILPRVAWNDPAWGKTYAERAKKLRQYYISEYSRFREEEGTPDYYRRRLVLNYLYKGPIIEWYLKTKLRLENNYKIYCDLLPREGEILDMGCGYGYISYMLAYTGPNRVITGVDFDPEKIRLAENCYDKTSRITFTCADVAEYDIIPQDGFLLSDVLHYLSPEKQEHLLRRCMENLKPGGVILIREANSELTRRHRKSRITEFLSTNIGFNKTKDDTKTLFFTSAEFIRSIAIQFDMKMRTIDVKRLTSNNLFVVTRNSTAETREALNQEQG